MYYVYIIRSVKDRKLYTGCTQDLKERLLQHNTGKVASTVNRHPLKLIFYECFINKEDAFAHEQWLKTGGGRNHINKKLLKTLKSLGG